MRRIPLGLRIGFGVLLGLVLTGLGVEFYYARKVYRALPGPKIPPRDPLLAIGSLSANSCAACHDEIAREWRASAHGQATTDVIYRAQLKDQGFPHFCDYCHAPLVEQRASITRGLIFIWPRQVALQRKNPRVQPALYHEGVTCVVCHQRDAAIVGPHDIGSAPHPTRGEPDFGNPTLCETCHALDIHVGSLLRPVQDTVAEWREYRAQGGEKQCIDCHMPDVGMRPLVPGSPARKSRSHAVRGPSDVEFLRTGILVRKVDIEPAAEGAIARVTLENGSGHRIPTAEPHRFLSINLSAIDSGPYGRELATAEQRIERHMDDERLIESPGEDSTLKPRETRTITVTLKGPLPKEATRLRLRVTFFLWDPDELFAMNPHLSNFDAQRIVYEETHPRR